MKKSLFVLLLVSQVLIFLLIPLQHALIGNYGKQITLLSEDVPSTEYYYEPYSNYDPLHINFEINYISDELWQPEENPQSGTMLYVVIRPNDAGIYEVVKVSEEKLQVSGEDVLLTGKYRYSNEMEKHHFVQYGFETVKMGYERFDFELNKQWLVSIDAAPWGQFAVRNVENYQK